MSRRPRRNHTPAFKAKVALAAASHLSLHGLKLKRSIAGIYAKQAELGLTAPSGA